MLNEAIEELKKQIAESKDEPEIEPEEEEKEETTEEEPAKEEEKPPEEEKKPDIVEEEKPDSAAFARMRREKAALERKLAAIEEAKNVSTEEVVDTHSAEIEEILTERKYTRAEREFLSMEAEYKRTNPEYGAIAAEYSGIVAAGIKAQNPRMSNDEVAQRTKKFILEKAGSYLNQGFNPVEELFHDAKELGLTGKSAKKEEVAEKEEPKPDMKKLAENRKRSAGTAAASGEERGQMTRQAAADLTNAEWSKLPQAEKRRLLYGS